MKLADTLDLGSSASRLAGSSPASPTSLRSKRSEERSEERRLSRRSHTELARYAEAD